jgi:hypothetical protein
MIRVIEGTPGATDTIRWPDVKGKIGFVVAHQSLRWKSRWVTERRKRPFFVQRANSYYGAALSWHATLESALAAAKRWERDWQ